MLPHLFSTHAFYEDRPSRLAVQRCLVSVCRKGDAALLSPLVVAIRQESQKWAIAASSAFVLAEWCSLLTQNLAGTPLWDKLGKDIILSNADTLEKCVQSSVRVSVAHSALVVARRGFRKLAALKTGREKAIGDAVRALTEKSSQPLAKNSVFLGVIAGVCSRDEKAKPLLTKLKSEYIAFYTREIIGSRTKIPDHIANGLHDFFCAFVSIDDLEKDVVLPLEKGFLRAPEIVLDDLVTPLVRALPKDFDLSKILNGHLLKPLLSSVKSSNAAIRNGAVSAFREMVTRCSDNSIMGQVADEIFAPMKAGKLASADHRIIHSDMLAAVPKSEAVAAKIAAGLSSVVAKEGNEAALTAEASALNACTKVLLLASTDLSKPVVDAYVKGLADKKPPFRRIWILLTGNALHSFSKPTDKTLNNAVKFAEAVLPPLIDTYNEVAANPLSPSQSGLVVGALVVCSITQSLPQDSTNPSLVAVVKKLPSPKQYLVVEPRPSFLLNPRVYSKLTTDDDLRWLYRALIAVFRDLPAEAGSSICLAWAQALLFVVCSVATGPNVRKEACIALSDLYAQSPSHVWKVVVAGLWRWLESMDEGDKESASALAKSGNRNLHFVLRSICLPPEEIYRRGGKKPNKEDLEQQLCSLLILARSTLIPPCKWIELCLQVQIDPGSLAQRREKLLLQEIAEKTRLDQKVRSRAMVSRYY